MKNHNQCHSRVLLAGIYMDGCKSGQNELNHEVYKKRKYEIHLTQN